MSRPLNAEYVGPSIVALILALYPLPWHLRTRNIATLSMIFWMTALNIVHTVNCVVWSDNTEVKARPWGDLSAVVNVGYNYGLPLAHLVLAKQLESYTSFRSSSPLYDGHAKRRHRIIDLSITFFGPIFAILVHLSNMDRRFYVVEKIGPVPATYWDTWGVIITAIVPILIASGVMVYTVMVLVNIHLRRQQMLSLIHSNASVNTTQFYRLLFLTLAEMGTCALRAIFNLLSFHNGPQPLGHRGPPRHDLRLIEEIKWHQISNTGHLTINLQYFTVVVCSIVFFLCFATSIETRRFYYNFIRYFFPCLPERDINGRRKLGSVDSGSVGVSSFASKGAISLYSDGTARSTQSSVPPIPSIRTGVFPVSPLSRCNHGSEGEEGEGDGNMSLEEMLGTPTTSMTPYTPSTPSSSFTEKTWKNYELKSGSPGMKGLKKAYSEEAMGAVYLAPYQTDPKDGKAGQETGQAK